MMIFKCMERPSSGLVSGHELTMSRTAGLHRSGCDCQELPTSACWEKGECQVVGFWTILYFA